VAALSVVVAMWRELVGTILLSWLPLLRSINHGPIGTISGLATETKAYDFPVKLSYFEAVNCTLTFNEDVAAFSPMHITKAQTTVISNFVEITKKLYAFQVSSMINTNLTISVAPRAVRSMAGIYNNDTTAKFNFVFYAFAPSVTLRLDGFEAQSTRRNKNIAYLLFNSTTQYDHYTRWFDASFVSISPAIEMKNFKQVSDMMYRFEFEIPMNESYPTVECVAPSASPSENSTIFACSNCQRPALCHSRTMYPPMGVKHMEFPLSVNLLPVPKLGLKGTMLPISYDTLWGLVTMDAPEYAKDSFWVTITWSEALSNLVAVQPTFDPTGPPVDQELLKQNLTILSPTSFKILVAPKRTGVLKISIYGSGFSVDVAGNSNDFYRNPASKTSASRTVIFSGGPPLAGVLAFGYERPRLAGEYPPAQGQARFQPSASASLTVSWNGFTTATSYDTWISWGKNESIPEAVGLNTSQYTFEKFSAMLGAEYQVSVRASNYWGESTTVVKTFLHPKFYIIADGQYSIMALPDMLSPTEKRVSVNALIPKRGFLSLNPLKVLSFRTANRSAGDQDPCVENSRIVKCTHLNFHMEVPATQFVVFRQPIRLQFIFGRQGWKDLYFRPRLRYWETHHDQWRDVADSCPQEQVFDRWNELHRIYEISVCHLSQFAVFEGFEPPALTTAAPAAQRPRSYAGAAFFIALAGVVVGGALICCCCYFGCSQSAARNFRRPLAYKDMGIRPVNERLPSRRVGVEALALPDAPEHGQLLALPPMAPPAGQILALPSLAQPPDTGGGVFPAAPPGDLFGLGDEDDMLEETLPNVQMSPGSDSVTKMPRIKGYNEEASAEAEAEPLGGGFGGFGVVPAIGPSMVDFPRLGTPQ